MTTVLPLIATDDPNLLDKGMVGGLSIVSLSESVHVGEDKEVQPR
jgi:hypothetical protein